MSTLLTASCLMMGSQYPLPAMTPEEMIKIKLISEVCLSPNKEAVLFVAMEGVINEDNGICISRIYKASSNGLGGSFALTSPDSSACQPKWSPDGQWIAFISDRDGVKNLYVMRADGGEAVAITKSKVEVQTFAWSPNSQQIACVIADDKDGKQKQNNQPIVYREELTINRLWLIDVFLSPPAIKRLTSDDYCIRGRGDFGTTNAEFDWSPDGSMIVFAFSPGLGADYFHLDSSLAVIDVASGTIIPWEKHAPYEALPRYSPDGKSVAYLCDDSSQRYLLNRKVALRSSNGQDFKLLAPTFNEGVFLQGPSLLGWSQDGKELMFFEPKGTKFHITLLPIDGTTAKELDTGDFFFQEPYISYDRSMIGFVRQAPNMPAEAYVSPIHHFNPVQVSHLNSKHAYQHLKTETVSWHSVDGQKIEGLLTYPVDYQPGQLYPLLLIVHGGPMACFSETFIGCASSHYPIASFAQSGFFVLKPNPRGSTGYGKKFRGANFADWGGKDFEDIMTGVDALIEKKMVDPERLGVMGWSYGGYMTTWIITQTSRFKAASIGAPPCNLASLIGTTDLYRFMTDYMGDYTHFAKIYEERSPFQFLHQVTTPCLILHGTDDLRVPVTQSYELYHALVRVGQKPTLILYPGMGHGITNPKLLLDVLKRNLSWFQDHLDNGT